MNSYSVRVSAKRVQNYFSNVFAYFVVSVGASLSIAADKVESGSWEGRSKYKLHWVSLTADGRYNEVSSGDGYELSARGTWLQEGDVIIVTTTEAKVKMPREREASWYRPITIDTQRARLVDGELLWKYTDETLSLKSKNLKYRASDPPSNQPDSPNPAEKKGIQPARVGRDGSVEEPITDEKYRAQVDAELKEAEKQWSKDERRKEDEFERIHNQKLEEWRTKLRNHTASYDDHPDVLMMKKLTGQEGTLIAPSVAKEYDNMLMDRGWYPYAKPGDWKYYYRSKRGDYDSKGPHPDVPSEIKLPGYNAVREHFLKGKSGN